MSAHDDIPLVRDVITSASKRPTIQACWRLKDLRNDCAGPDSDNWLLQDAQDSKHDHDHHDGYDKTNNTAHKEVPLGCDDRVTIGTDKTRVRGECSAAFGPPAAMDSQPKLPLTLTLRPFDTCLGVPKSCQSFRKPSRSSFNEGRPTPLAPMDRQPEHVERILTASITLGFCFQ